MWHLGFACLAFLGAFLCAITVFRWPGPGKFFGVLAGGAGFAAAFPWFLESPFMALLGAVALITGSFMLLDFSPGSGCFRSFFSEKNAARHRGGEDMWDRPAAIVFFTFLGLCLMGTLMLLLPGIMGHTPIALVDAAFTSVSAVCVTGLAVLDTPTDFSMAGQGVILVLIQFGGLGIMSITTVAMHAMGRRLSLRQERLMTSLMDADRKDLLASLVLILKFTFLVEAVGAIFLGGVFYTMGDSPGQAAWRGSFTAVSAFCNAGFSLQTQSLVPYKDAPMVLHMVAVLIIFGGMAPATSLLIPRWVRGRNIPVTARIDLVSTAVLLISGTLFILAFEWNGVLSDLSFVNKIHNAWFQSATLRTAGFNSVDLAGVMSPTFLVMLCLMFIGGAPGGTAGGIKVTTVAILAMTFWANITHCKGVILGNRHIRPVTIFRAVTIVISGGMIWFMVVLMLEVTQQIPARSIIFEATSAIATVGLSMGVTAQFDQIGKCVVMLAMFIGRIGPLTLFMLLSNASLAPVSHCPDAKITLT
ncbi:trk system potassium uptake protein TrkH [Desulfocicer vacuolatum DSM 3385]|uniref:Trk system potassium uptake protein TrkH n=2 Tax=Desulfocicer vacuolatum TaxID=2298 RepID=A0A1W2DQI7_9BACT|nr:trk system potassium uptake protein TrkH [Desulfocicer vacuolatum DSM 3385]